MRPMSWRDSIGSAASRGFDSAVPWCGSPSREGSGSDSRYCLGGTVDGDGTGHDGPAEYCFALPVRGRGRAGVARSRASAELRLQPRVAESALVMISRDRRALVLGGSVVIGAVFVLRMLPWGIRSALAAEAGLRQREALLARARADLAEASGLRDSAVQLGRALVGLAPKILSGNSVAEAVARPSGRGDLAAARNHAMRQRGGPPSGTARPR